MKNRKTTKYPIALLMLFQSLLFAQDNLRDSIYENSLVEEFLKKTNTNSLVIGTIKDEKQILRFYGVINNYGQKKRKPNGETLYEIGSITKVFTTLAFAALVNDDSLLLNDCAVDFLPYQKKKYPSALREVSLLNLATHTSGLRRITLRSIGGVYIIIPVPFWYLNVPRVVYKLCYMRNPYKNYDSKKLLADMRHIHLKSTPGERFSYSNIGVGLLGYILTQKAKAPFDTLLANTVLKPLNMNNTWINMPKSQMINLATGHNRLGLRTDAWTFKEGMQGAAALTTSGNDMMKFLNINISAKQEPLEPLLKLSHKTYFKTKSFEVGLGWIKTKSNKTEFHEIIWHNGGTGGFRSFVGINKETKTGIVILSNGSRKVDDLALTILNHLIKKETL